MSSESTSPTRATKPPSTLQPPGSPLAQSLSPPPSPSPPASERESDATSDTASTASDAPPRLSLADQFAALCAETPEPPASPQNPTAAAAATPAARAALSALTDPQRAHLAQNESGEVYLAADTIPSLSTTSHADVQAAISAALEVAFDAPRPARRAFSLEEPDDAAERSFAELAGLAPFAPMPALKELTWANSLSRRVVDAFNDESDRIREERQRADAAEAADAMARAAAASASARPQRRSTPRRPPSYSADPVLWAAQEESAAAAVLRELRAAPRKKGSRSEAGAAWNLLGLRSGKLKPEAAAEMARAKMAAAAAVAAMREGTEEEVEAKGKPGAGNGRGSGRSGLGSFTEEEDEEDVNLYVEYLSPRTRASSGRFDTAAIDFGLLESPPMRRAMSLDSSGRLKKAGKKKRVEFAADTIFKERK